MRRRPRNAFLGNKAYWHILGFKCVIRLHSIKFGKKKVRRQSQLDEAVGPVQRGCHRNFLDSIISRLKLASNADSLWARHVTVPV